MIHKLIKISITLSIVALIGAHLRVTAIGGTDIIDSVQDIPVAPIALVFGGGMKDDQTMSDLQTDRVDIAIDLYKAGKVQSLLMTGDDGKMNANEVEAMRFYALERGVPSSSVKIDGEGYNTYASCSRAAEIFEIDRAIVISQRFHIPRIQYLCRGFGIDTVALTADISEYGFLGRIWGMHGREYLARVKAVMQKEWQKPDPKTFSEETKNES
ncbi:MAG: DUF218 domain-containing protein [Candidatus Magasanikbacteria bacterium]|jgi:vancomycin permeability regulator SanA|nr:DUF218 domain-containing protein [Candidatus Magasanikbacteria bacterium]